MEPIFQRFGDVTIQRLDKPKPNAELEKPEESPQPTKKFKNDQSPSSSIQPPDYNSDSDSFEDESEMESEIDEPSPTRLGVCAPSLAPESPLLPPAPKPDEYDFDIKEKLKEMGEISFQTVKKGEPKSKKPDTVENEVSVIPAKKPTEDEKKSTNLRRNIREVMDETKLDESTLAAQRLEAERLHRVQEQQRILREYQKQAHQERMQNKVISLLQGNNLNRPSTSKIGSTVLVKLPNGQTKPMTRLPKRPFDMVKVHKTSGPQFPSIPNFPSGPMPIRHRNLSHMLPKANLTPSVSIAPVLKPKEESGEESEEEARAKSPVKEPETIDISSDEDCILVSEPEEDEPDDDPSNCGMHTNDDFNQPDSQGRVVANIAHPDDELDVFLAPQIARIIKPHQIGGVRFLYDNVIESTSRFAHSTGFGCILAHSMGLGKTLQLVCFSDIFFRHTPSRTILCIMPINTLQNWLAEYNMWLPTEESLLANGGNLGEVRPRTFNLHVLNDSHKTLTARHRVIKEWRLNGGVLLIGYEQFRLLSMRKSPKSRRKVQPMADLTDDKNKVLFDDVHQALVNPGPDLVICDEGHRIKNSHASVSQALKQIRTKRRIVLTGYPLQNNLMEYWCMVDFVRPNYLGSKTEFCNMFERPIMNGQCIDSTQADIKLMRYRAHVLHSLLVGFVQRRSHAVLQIALPQKEEYVLMVRMLPFQRKLYETFMDEVVRSQAVPNPLKAFAVCCKIWNHPDVLYNFLKKRARGDAVDIDLEEVGGAVVEKVKKGPGKPRKNAKVKKGEKPAASVTPYNSNLETGDCSFKSAIEQSINFISGIEQPTNSRSGIEQLTNSRSGIEQLTNSRSGIEQPTNSRSGIDQQPSIRSVNEQQNNIRSGIEQLNNSKSGLEQSNSTSSTFVPFSNCSNQFPAFNQTNNYQNYWQNEQGNYQNLYQQQPYNPNFSSNNANQGWIKKEEPLSLASSIKSENSSDIKKGINILSDIKLPGFGNLTDSKIKILSDIKIEPKPELGEIKSEIKQLLDEVKQDEDEFKLAETSPVKLGRDKEDTGIPYDWAVELLKDYIPGCIENSAKMEILFCIIRESLALSDRLLVFSQSLITLDLIEQFLQSTIIPGDSVRWARNASYYRLDGSTSALEREKLINEFNVNPKIHLFLVSTRAGSLGINLIGANRVVVLDASWNPCHDTQAVCRVYRYGQKKPCFVYRLVVDNCLEKKIYDRQINKQGMSDRVVDECNPDAHLTLKDVTSLCWDDEVDDGEERDFLELREKYSDLILRKVIENHGRRLNKQPFQHESLLVDRKEKQLSKSEKRLAKKGYEREKQAARQPSFNLRGAAFQRPVASVRPMQQPVDRPTRWIPAEHWQRQGMTAQEMTLPLDVVIPTSVPVRGNIILKAGQKVLILKSPKGVYMQLESGKIVSIKTAIKVKGKAEEKSKKLVKPGTVKMNVKSVRQAIGPGFERDVGPGRPRGRPPLHGRPSAAKDKEMFEALVESSSGDDEDEAEKLMAISQSSLFNQLGAEGSSNSEDEAQKTVLDQLEQTTTSVENNQFQETLDSITNSYREEPDDKSEVSDEVTYVGEQPPTQAYQAKGATAQPPAPFYNYGYNYQPAQYQNQFYPPQQAQGFDPMMAYQQPVAPPQYNYGYQNYQNYPPAPPPPPPQPPYEYNQPVYGAYHPQPYPQQYPPNQIYAGPPPPLPPPPAQSGPYQDYQYTNQPPPYYPNT